MPNNHSFASTKIPIFHNIVIIFVTEVREHQYGGSVHAMADSPLLREQILHIVAKIIDKGGEKAVRIRDVCVASKTTPPTIYRIFGDRTGLIVAAQS